VQGWHRTLSHARSLSHFPSPPPPSFTQSPSSQCELVRRYVKMVGCDAGPAPIISDPVHQTIPFGYIPKLSHEHPCACPDRRLNSGDGSELFIVDRWSLEQSSPGHAPTDDDGTCVCGFYSIGHACPGTLRVSSLMKQNKKAKICFVIYIV
jgi:hypothetical protein